MKVGLWALKEVWQNYNWLRVLMKEVEQMQLRKDPYARWFSILYLFDSEQAQRKGEILHL